MKLPFTHAGKTRHLVKPARIQDELRKGKITEADARTKPWVLRWQPPGETKPRTFTLSVSDRQAIADALDKLNGQQKHPASFAEFLAVKDARRGLTVGALAADWLAASCPFSKTKPRTAAEAQPLRANLDYALDWWTPIRWTAITVNTLEDYAAHRRAQVQARYKHCTAGGQHYTGERAVDVELAALSCLAQWAVLTGRVEKNPFEKRPRFRSAADVKHCHEAMPDNDEHLHQILTWLFTHRHPAEKIIGRRHEAATLDHNARLTGGWLAFCALSGLRPGEPRFLQRVPEAKEFPNLKTAPPGQIYPMPDGTRRMKVFRLKRGQNPAILIHPALDDFLQHWHQWLDHNHFPALGPLFPPSPPRTGRGIEGEVSNPSPSPLAGKRALEEMIAHHLKRACTALNLPPLRPHGFGRGYYVRVRRSQGEDDPAIAVELGQTSKGDLIRRDYGDPVDPVGGNLHDWLPKDGTPAWTKLLPATDSNLIPVQFGTSI